MANLVSIKPRNEDYGKRHIGRLLSVACLLLIGIGVQTLDVHAQSTPVKLSGDMPSYSSVYTTYGWSNIKLSRDGDYVVFVANIEADEHYELYSAPADGAAPPVRLSHTLPGAKSMIYHWFEITPDSRRVVFTAEQNAAGMPQLYSVGMRGEGLIEIPLPEGGQGVWNFTVSADSEHVVYRPDPEPLIARSAESDQSDYMLVSVDIDEDGSTGQLGAVYVRQKQVGTNLHAGEGPFRLATQDASGDTQFVRHFGPPVPSSGSAGADTHAFTTAEILPVGEGITRLQLYRNADDQLLDSRTITPNSPQVSFTEPSTPNNLDAPFTVAWQASDADGDLLTFSLQYSHDDGVSWSPVVTGLAETRYVIDPGSLAKAEAGQLRILATDGFNTVEATMPYTFSVTGKPPQVAIVAPAVGRSFQPSDTITMEGFALDLEEGVIGEDSAYSWHSNHNGALGSGRMIDAQWLALGEHEITLTVVDNDDMQSNARTAIRVTDHPPNDDPIGGLSVEGPDSALISDEVAFAAEVEAGTNVYYEWDLGDGTTSTGQRVSHRYAEATIYPVTVRAVNSAGSESLVVHVQIAPISVHIPIVMQQPEHHGRSRTRKGQYLS